VMGGYDRDGNGNYIWKCWRCGKRFVKTTPQGRGIARSNHLRSHGIYTVKGKIGR